MTAWHDPLSKKHQARRGSKFGAVKVERAGHSFASKAEASLFDYLKLLERAGEIDYLGEQKHVVLVDGDRNHRIEYIADFLVFDKKLNANVYCEMKGFQTDVWRLKRRLWFSFGPTLLRVYMKKGNVIYLHEEIEGKSQ